MSTSKLQINTGKSFKARHSKYRHFYIGDKTVCGSKAKSNNVPREIGFWEYCRKCKTIKAKIARETTT